MAKKKLQIRKATIRDAASIHSLVNKFAKKDEMLPRSLNEIYEIKIPCRKKYGVIALNAQSFQNVKK
jgi:hypothetical protein